MAHSIHLDKVGYDTVGTLGEWKLYRPHGEIKGNEWWSENFSCNAKQLVLNGGGYFETETVVIPYPERVVSNYIVLWGLMKFDDDSKQSRDYLQLFDKEIYPLLKQYLEPNEPLFRFPGWCPENYVNFINSCKNTEVFTRPLLENEMVEDWLCSCLGEFILFDYNQICPEFISIIKSAVGYVNERTWSNVKPSI